MVQQLKYQNDEKVIRDYVHAARALRDMDKFIFTKQEIELIRSVRCLLYEKIGESVTMNRED